MVSGRDLFNATEARVAKERKERGSPVESQEEAKRPECACALKVLNALERLAEAFFAIWQPKQTGFSNGCWCRFFYLRNAMTKFSASGTCFTVSFIRHPVKVLERIIGA